MNPFRKIMEKPWDPSAEESAMALAIGPGTQYAGQRLMLHIFLVIVSVVFLLMFATFITHSQFPGFQPLAGEPWSPFANTTALWLNTLWLALSSLAMHVALIRLRHDAATQALWAMLLAAFLAAAFVLAQFSLWRTVSGMGYALHGNPANSYFYLLTAVHALHLLGGLFVLVRAIWLLWRGAETARMQTSLSLSTTYWHYLLVLWALVFFLLTRSPETYRAIAVFCGLG
ncbi:cytochrome c oxidase subunit 3 [Salinispirillum sp. LH 10-3-1]|uniref:Cytochrome c oxidase subunit 3 n=1 Tax=Salinispirillum sp. LH 10-3-1 TaxID=2952525 RepID=A0AB38YFR1_9GAMM